MERNAHTGANLVACWLAVCHSQNLYLPRGALAFRWVASKLNADEVLRLYIFIVTAYILHVSDDLMCPLYICPLKCLAY